MISPQKLKALLKVAKSFGVLTLKSGDFYVELGPKALLASETEDISAKELMGGMPSDAELKMWSAETPDVSDEEPN